MTEKWAIIKSNSKYEVSTLGIVRNTVTGKTLKPMLREGYCRIEMSKKAYSIHRLVAEAFIPNPENKPQINHINGVKTDNRLENLEWCTGSENQKHAYSINLRSVTGSKNPAAKLNESLVMEIKAKLLPWTGFTCAMLAREYGVGQTRINDIKHRRKWTHV